MVAMVLDIQALAMDGVVEAVVAQELLEVQLTVTPVAMVVLV